MAGHPCGQDCGHAVQHWGGAAQGAMVALLWPVPPHPQLLESWKKVIEKGRSQRI